MKKEQIDKISEKLDKGKMLDQFNELLAQNGFKNIKVSGIKFKEAKDGQEMLRCDKGKPKLVHVPGHGFVWKCVED